MTTTTYYKFDDPEIIAPIRVVATEDSDSTERVDSNGEWVFDASVESYLRDGYDLIEITASEGEAMRLALKKKLLGEVQQ